MQYGQCYERGKQILEEAGVPESALDARLLLEDICHTDRNTLLVHRDMEVSAEQQEAYEKALKRRADRIPLQHITGTQDFMGLTFRVNEQVLIPRQDTEILVEEVMRQMQDGIRILDMCTGSGCILVSLLHYSNGSEGVGADLSEEALKVAKVNADAILGTEAKVTFVHSDLFTQVEGKFDLIVSNPPYIQTAVIEGLMPEVRDHEPYMALDGKEDGLFFYREIIEKSPAYLMGGGRLYFEIGYDQGPDVKALMEQTGFQEVEIVKDYAGLDRVVHGLWLG